MEKPPRWSHQQKILDETKDLENFALFWEMGAAKTRPVIETVAHNFLNGRINALVVVTDRGVHSQWNRLEIPKWMPDEVEWRAAEYHSSKASTKTHQKMIEDVLAFRGLAVLTISWDAAAITEKGKIALWRFLKHRKCFFVADETSAIKTPGAKRSRAIVAAARYAVMRRIMNGTPIEGSVMEIFQQFKVLDEKFWVKELGIANYTVFKSEFGVYVQCTTEGGGQFSKLVSYKNLDKLRAAYAKISSRVLKEDVLDLPPKIYEYVPFEMSTEQERVYNRLRDECMVDIGEPKPCENCQGTGLVEYGDDDAECVVCFGGGIVHTGLMTALLPIVKLLRLSMVACGYQQADGSPTEDIPGPNPRLEALERSLQQAKGPFVVFARFQRDIDKIMDVCKGLDLRAGAYDGRTNSDDRTKVREGFQKGELDVFVGNPAACARGITLDRAHTVIFYNNNFRIGHRLQAEDRVHRGTIKHNVLYLDIIAKDTVDEHVVRALLNKVDVGRSITQDRLREWLKPV